jgi:hypothetical protein
MSSNAEACLKPSWIMPVIAFWQRLISISTALLIAAIAATEPAGAAGSGTEGGFERCRTISDDALRLRCFEDATLPPAKKTPTTPGGWKVIRTPRPQGGGEAVSIIHTPDLIQSDPDLAGLMLRCSDKGVEVLVILISPFPPRSHPVITVPSAKDNLQFAATVVPPGAALRLPDGALELANGPWQSLAELPIKVEDAGTSIRGVVPLGGLDAALKTLKASCPTP